MDELAFLADGAAKYICFGLAVYAIGAIVALLCVRDGITGRSQASADTWRVGACLIGLLVMEIVRQFWDTFHTQPFPSWITRLTLPMLYLTLGNSVSRLSQNKSSGESEELRSTGTSSAARL